MKVCVELHAANGNSIVTKDDLQDNINTLDSYISKAKGTDAIKLMDTRSILIGLQQNLPRNNYDK